MQTQLNKRKERELREKKVNMETDTNDVCNHLRKYAAPSWENQLSGRRRGGINEHLIDMKLDDTFNKQPALAIPIVDSGLVKQQSTRRGG